jgi:hypothetical protein
MATSFGSDTSISVILLLIQITDENLQILSALSFFCPQNCHRFQIIFALKRFPTTTKNVKQTLFFQLLFSTWPSKELCVIYHPAQLENSMCMNTQTDFRLFFISFMKSSQKRHVGLCINCSGMLSVRSSWTPAVFIFRRDELNQYVK